MDLRGIRCILTSSPRHWRRSREFARAPTVEGVDVDLRPARDRYVTPLGSVLAMDPTADVSISAVQDGQMPNRRSDVDLLINYPVLVDRSFAHAAPTTSILAAPPTFGAAIITPVLSLG